MSKASTTSSSGAMERLVDRHMTIVEVRRRLNEQQAATRSTPGPWITISKQLGSGGVAIAREVGRRLGWQVFDREVLEEIARHAHSRDKVLSRLDEHAVGRLDEFLSNLILPAGSGQLPFVHEMTKVIWTLGREGHSILVGRGANWILDPAHGLRVRIVAPLERRAAAIAAAERIPPADAKRRAANNDAQLADFARQVYGREIGDPLGYDVCLNTETLDVPTAAGLIVTVLSQKLGARAVAETARPGPQA